MASRRRFWLLFAVADAMVVRVRAVSVSPLILAILYFRIRAPFSACVSVFRMASSAAVSAYFCALSAICMSA